MAGTNKLLIIQAAALGARFAQARGWPRSRLAFQSCEGIFPALTCPVQATFRTGRLPADHGVSANGFFDRTIRRTFFWEQSAALVAGTRWWTAGRAAGRRVGLVCWQQSLGEAADFILSPKPVHKHHGGLIQDCYTQPPPLYADLCTAIGRPFQLAHYWGPLANRRSSTWIAEALVQLMAVRAGPDLLCGYLPHLDYDLQRYGPEHPAAAAAADVLDELLARLLAAARSAGYDVLVFGDYAMETVSGPPVYPNRALRADGLFEVRSVRGRAYPDFFAGRALAVTDHQVALVYCADPAAAAAARDVLSQLDGVGQVRETDPGLRARGGELMLVAAPGRWFAYPWWTAPGEAPDYARHIDIHNKPGYDPAELFWGWPPPSVSRNPGRVRGTHGRGGPGLEVAWAATFEPAAAPENLVALAALAKRHWEGGTP
ncbi:MAG: alkaline phosphatase family protein [Candidatus Marinimicrobia bacterium]|nr:alkaline phosphatase family protein [Candidatus Neomarinimicrobiota bacterium]